MSAGDQSSTFSEDEATTLVTGSVDEESPAAVSSVETEQEARPVAASFDPPAEAETPETAQPAFWGLRPRDCLVLSVLFAAFFGLSIWHWGQLSGWGIRPVEIERLPERVYDYRVDLNQATWVELIQLPGIGQALAQRIIEHREEHGPFQSVEELDDINGIGPKTLEKIRPWLIIRDEDQEKSSTESDGDSLN